MTDTPLKDQGMPNVNSMTGHFAIQKVYVKDISFETPNSPAVFAEEWSPKVDMHLGSKASKVHDNLTEVVLSVTLTTKLGDRTAYLVEAHVAGIFLIKDFPGDVMEHLVAAICPNILFPFAREVVCDLVTRGGFPQLLLTPVNFEALYAQQKKQEESAADTDNNKH